MHARQHHSGHIICPANEIEASCSSSRQAQQGGGSNDGKKPADRGIETPIFLVAALGGALLGCSVGTTSLDRAWCRRSLLPSPPAQIVCKPPLAFAPPSVAASPTRQLRQPAGGEWLASSAQLARAGLRRSNSEGSGLAAEAASASGDNASRKHRLWAAASSDICRQAARSS